MEGMIQDYSEYFDGEKNFFKSFLNEIIFYDNIKNENKWKKSILQKEIEQYDKQLFENAEKYLLNKGISKDDVEKIPKDYLIKEAFWITDEKKESFIGFPVYLWTQINNKNDNLFIRRLSVLNYLVDKHIIKISNFNPVASINEIEKSKNDFIIDSFSERKNLFIDKFWEDIGNRQIEWLKGKEKYLQFIIFERKKITKLLHLIKESEIKEFKYENRALFYWWRPIYPQVEYSDRSLFIELLFSKPKWTYFQLIEIYKYLEWWDDYYLKPKQSKKIYNLKDKINARILKETKIKKLFSLWKWDNKGEIYRLY